MRLFFIDATGGGDSDDNHVRGPYRSQQDAERRIQFYLSADNGFHPLASPIFPRGKYQIFECEAMPIAKGLYSVNGHFYLLERLSFVFVGRDGHVADNGSEWFDELSSEWQPIQEATC